MRYFSKKIVLHLIDNLPRAAAFRRWRRGFLYTVNSNGQPQYLIVHETAQTQV